MAQMIGEILVSKGYITQQQLDGVLAVKGPDAQVGQVLIEWGLLTQEQLMEALEIQTPPPPPPPPPPIQQTIQQPVYQQPVIPQAQVQADRRYHTDAHAGTRGARIELLVGHPGTEQGVAPENGRPTGRERVRVGAEKRNWGYGPQGAQGGATSNRRSDSTRRLPLRHQPLLHPRHHPLPHRQTERRLRRWLR